MTNGEIPLNTQVKLDPSSRWASGDFKVNNPVNTVGTVVPNESVFDNDWMSVYWSTGYRNTYHKHETDLIVL